MTYDQCLFDEFISRLGEKGGALRLTLQEALTWWIVVLQREATESNPAKAADEIDTTPKLMVLGMDGDDELFTEVVLTQDNPENLADGTWHPIELWN
jgi:hypothetical protein